MALAVGMKLIGILAYAAHDPSSTEQKSADNNDNDKNEVAKWLKNIVELPQYLGQFEEEGYDDLLIIKETLTEEDLIKIGINKRGHRKKILLYASKLKFDDSNDDDAKVNVKKNFMDHIEGVNVHDSAQKIDNQGIVGVNIYDTAK